MYVIVPEATLRRFRRRIALTNKRAGWHYLALERSTRGQDPIDRDTSYARATSDELRCGIGRYQHGVPGWDQPNRDRWIAALHGVHE